MKHVLLTTLLLLLSFATFSQKTFCDGWEDGYLAGKTAMKEYPGLTPLCPLPQINADTYEIGYQLGYERVTGKTKSVILTSSENDKTFCDGWEDGYISGKTAMKQYPGLAPLCPLPQINADTYEIGYQRGYERATGTTNNNVIKVYQEEEKTFCDGWEEGYLSGKTAMNEYPGITPICPIPGINADTYENGYQLGYESVTGKTNNHILKLDKEEEEEGEEEEKTFCGGWEDGYLSGKTAKNEYPGITPICPIARINADTYEIGYQLGYERATGVSNSVILKAPETENTFCDGWEKGYSNTMSKNGKLVFNVPNCPVPMLTEDNYESGYIKGLTYANNQLGLETDEIVGYDPEAKFCDGWEKGYAVGLQLWAEKHKVTTPLRITPFCPFPDMNQDNYASGFERGKNKALEDLGD